MGNFVTKLWGLFGTYGIQSRETDLERPGRGMEGMGQRKLFCQWGPVCYRISLKKEALRRRLWDWRERTAFARTRQVESLPVVVKGHRSPILRPLHGVDMALQENKRQNLALAAPCVDGICVEPGQVFSFWALVGPPTARRGYREGLTIGGGRFYTGVGGGLCQLANLIHYLVLNSPLTVRELHHHSDALFPDARRRVPLGTGTAIFYPPVDYRFRNDTDQTVQLRVWLEGDDLCGELRAGHPFLRRYRLREEGAGYVREGEDWFRVSQVYREVLDRATGEVVGRELVLDNHSRVMYDPALIPQEETV